MSLKDLFGKTTEKVVNNQNLQEFYNQGESEDYVEAVLKDKERFLPLVDFSNPANFAFYGSAEKYYVDAFKNIYQNYPYDGSKKEKQEWANNASQLDLYLFNDIYPKSVGHVQLSGSSPSVVSNVRSSSVPQYVLIKGGPNPSSTGKFETSNIYDVNSNRESNLGITEYGNTVEFWFKDNAISGTAFSQAKYCLFDLWNGVTSSAANYTRLTIAKSASISENKFIVSYVSGSSGVSEQVIDYQFDPYNWHHYAFTFKNAENNLSDLEINLYIDGELAKKQLFSGFGNINLADNTNLIAFIGAYRANQSGVLNAGSGPSFGSFDEFRFWKTARTTQQIYRNWFTQVGGGSNTDDANKNLGVYLKFNEGLIDSQNINSLDSICLDYSGRVSNGTIINYTVNNKKITSAIDVYFDKEKETKDPIVFPSNPLVQTAINNYRDYGFQHDQNNSSNIYKSIPAWITDEAEKNDLPDLQQLIQIVASYFDSLFLQIQSLPRIKNIVYDSNDSKPKPFAKNLLSSNGFENLEIFNDTTFLESVLSRNEKEEFGEKVHNIKNAIYQNIYNNLSYIYKSKGTEKSLRNFIRCFGIDDELVKINLYANNAEYDLSTKYIYNSVAKKFVDFNDPDRFTGYIYQKAKSGDSNTLAFIPSNNSSNWHYVPITVQSEVIFPKNPIIESNKYVLNDFVSSSLYGVHTALSNPNDFSWGSDEFNFQVYSVRTTTNSPDAYFTLTGSFNGYPVSLSTNVFKDIYDNQKWNFAVRIKPDKLNHINLGSGSLLSDYTLEFVGINSIGDSINNDFLLTASVSQADMQAALQVNKRVYAGAHYTDFNNTLLENKTDVKISSVRFWYDYLSNEELVAHSYEALNYGRQQPNWPPSYLLGLSGTLSSNATITKIDTLALHWNFFNVSSSDTNGQFIVEDVSSGSVEAASYYGLDWLGSAAKYQMPGFADEFFANDDQVINKEYVFSSKKQNPEVLNGNDLIQIVNSDDVTRTKDSRLISYYISVEKSMAQVINDEIMNWFATIKSYNNLIGEPLQRYKQEYSGLNHLRELFFSKVNNSINFEKFFEFYKWIDSSLSMMINQLVPASANSSDKVRNIVESHMLERSKYSNKLPTIEFKGIPDSSSIEPYTFSISKLQSLEDSINPVNISNNLFNSEFIFASASLTGSGQIVQPVKKKGNYYQSYEYLFTSGRTSNNKSFVDLEGNITSSSTVYTLGFTDSTLPVRSINKQIIVERFSSPGGPEVNGRGYLDDAAEEYSVYNSLNYRNSRVRKVLNVWMAESASIDENYPSYHKVNKNPTYIPISETSSLTEPYYDNGFVQHAIPRSEAQYAWITASLSVKPSASGYISEYDNLDYNYEFLSGTSTVDYVGLNTTIAKTLNTSSNTINPAASITDFNAYISNLNGPYQHPSWKQIRNFENKLSIESRKNNNILLQNTRKETVNGNEVAFLNINESLFTSFKEPPVSYNKPMRQNVDIAGSTDTIQLVNTYDNNKERFVNKDLIARTGINEREELQTYDIINSLDKNGFYEPAPQLVEAEYKAQIYPSKENVGLKETRSKPNYAEVAGTGSNGYDRNSGEIRSFWRDSVIDRRRTNAFYSSTKTGSLNNLNIAQLSASSTSSLYDGFVRYKSGSTDIYGSASFIPTLTSSKNFNNYYDSNHSLDISASYRVSIDYNSGHLISLNEISSTIMGDLDGFDEVESRLFLSKQSGTYFYQSVTRSSDQAELVEYFKYDPSYNFVRPKASYVYKIHYPSAYSFFYSNVEPGSTSSTSIISAYNNEGMLYKTNILAGKNPWYDSYEDYFADIKPLSQDKTLLPEYTFSEHADYFIKDNNGDFKVVPPSNYISFAGSDVSVNNYDGAYNITDTLNNFIFNDITNSDKTIKLSINSVKKLLPYRGFYPQERTAQIVDLFQKSFFDISMNDITGGYPTYRFLSTDSAFGGGGFPQGAPLVQQVQTLLQPYFAPGILFNTIKSGIAVDWPILYSSEGGSSYNSYVLGTVQRRKPPNHNTASFATDTITEKVVFLSGAFSNRIPFESLLDFRELPETDALIYLDPTRFSRETFIDISSSNITTGRLLASIDGLRKNPIFSFNNKYAKNNQSKKFLDNRYTLAINNFLAETPRFFLQNQNLTSFTSQNDVSNITFEVGKVYEMYVQIEKQPDVKMILDSQGGYPYYYSASTQPLVLDETPNGTLYTSSVKFPAASLFGPPSQYFISSTGSEMENGHKAYDSPAYAPYAPPYYYGAQRAKLAFTASSEIYTSYREIINLLTVSCEPSTGEINDYFSASIDNIGGDSNIDFSSVTAYANRMPLTSSIKYDVLVGKNQVKYGLDGQVIDITDTNDVAAKLWRIQTKFETPILNFNTTLNNSVDVAKDIFYLNKYDYLDSGGKHLNSLKIQNTSFGFMGMWGGYAQTGSNSGVSLNIIKGRNKGQYRDLAETCGFNSETKYVGQIAAKKEISEAIVMIPFTRIKNHREGKDDANFDKTKARTIKEIIGENGKTSDVGTNGPYYFGVDRLAINTVLRQNGVNVDFDSKVSYRDLKNILSNIESDNSILKTMKAMSNYVLPPHLDWLYNRNISPFVMYVFEFKHELAGDELADIWQGVMPKSAMQASLDTVEIEHALNDLEFFHGKKLPDDIQWKVFKVKRRANYSYDSLVTGVEERFNFKSRETEELVYSYNWPYDYFSLVELVNVEASLNVKPIIPTVTTTTGQQAQTTRQQTLTVQEAARQTEATKEEPSISTLKNTKV